MTKLSATGQTLGDAVSQRIYYGIKTGLNEAFVIDQASYDDLISTDPKSKEVLKPLVRGQDLRPWYRDNPGMWLILFPSKWTRAVFGSGLTEDEAWTKVSERYSAVARHLQMFEERARKRQDQGDFWWELRPCDYYDAFDIPKIMWPDIAKIPRFLYDTDGVYLGNTGYVCVPGELWILGFLASRCAWFLISHTSTALGERAGLNRYRLIDQFMRPLPVPNPVDQDKKAIEGIVKALTENARTRHTLHQRARHRITVDLGTPDRKLNQKLTAWWGLDFSAFRAEITKVFKREIPVGERDQWETWLANQRAEHERLTREVIRLETDLNERVYTLYDLTSDEIALIEEVTKYEYGEV